MTERNKLTDLQAKWLEALESGKYGQVIDTFCHNGKHCCLAVATDVVDPKHPSLNSNGWAWSDYDEDEYPKDERYQDGPFAPPEVVEAMHLVDSSGTFRFGVKIDEEYNLAKLNDIGWTFERIAELIHSKPWLVFTNFDQPEVSQ